MNRATARGLAAVGMLILSSCAAQVGSGSRSLYAEAPAPPDAAEQDLTVYNSQRVAAFVTTDPGWRAWLNAFQESERAHNAIFDTSTFNMPVVQLIQDVSIAQDAYRSATTFSLPPFSVRSSCLKNASETDGSIRLSDGLLVRYSHRYSLVQGFSNGSSCRMAVGSVDEVDSSRGLPIVAIAPPGDGGGARSDSANLVWNAPFSEISRESTWSFSDLIAFIESGKPPRAVQSPSQCLLF